MSILYLLLCIDFKGAIAGGGRYDNLIGKFLGQQVSAVGFSIGFERIFSILMQNGVETKASADKIAVMYDEGQVKEAYAIAPLKSILSTSNTVPV